MSMVWFYTWLIVLRVPVPATKRMRLCSPSSVVRLRVCGSRVLFGSAMS